MPMGWLAGGVGSSGIGGEAVAGIAAAGSDSTGEGCGVNVGHTGQSLGHGFQHVL